MLISRASATVVAFTCAVSLAGCKGGATHKAVSHARHAVSSHNRSSSNASPSSSAANAPSAATLWQTAQSKLRADKTLRVQFAGSKDMTGEGQGDQPFATTIEGETSGASTHVISSVPSSNMTVEIIRVQGRSYLKGNDAYWQKMVHSTSSPTAKTTQNANRWVIIPKSGLAQFSPSSLPQVLHGLTDSQATLPAGSSVSESTFHGTPCWKIDESTTQSLYISRDTHELVGLTKSGDTSRSGDIHEFQFSDANKDFNITAPTDAITP